MFYTFHQGVPLKSSGITTLFRVCNWLCAAERSACGVRCVPAAMCPCCCDVTNAAVAVPP
jgi:hypothetical protein